MVRQNIVVFTGAGISAESGIPTFRDSNGMWNKYDAKKLASVAGFEENPQAVLDFYHEFLLVHTSLISKETIPQNQPKSLLTPTLPLSDYRSSYRCHHR